jgi:hypothetical protein
MYAKVMENYGITNETFQIWLEQYAQNTQEKLLHACK